GQDGAGKSELRKRLHTTPPASLATRVPTRSTLMILAELVDGLTAGVERRFRRKVERSSAFRGPRPADPRRETVNQFRELHHRLMLSCRGARASERRGEQVAIMIPSVTT